MPPESRQLRRLAEKFLWIKQIHAPDAPGLCFFGGEVRGADFGHCELNEPPVSVSGKGFTREQAFTGVVGEGGEYLSQLEWCSEDLVRGEPTAVAHQHDTEIMRVLFELLGIESGAPEPELDWMVGHRMADGSEVLIPADLCLRRVAGRGIGDPPSALSTGCAAGSSLSEATLRALLEVVERDAAALWWLGGRRGRPIGLDELDRADALPGLRALRGDATARPTWMLDITSDTRIPCVAAASVDRQGRGFASGLAARLNLGDAIRGAILELCQIELGHHLVEAKRQVRGDGALNDADRRNLERSETFDAAECSLLYPHGVPRCNRDPGPLTVEQAIREVSGRLLDLGAEPLIVDLTRPGLEVPVARVLVPGLQPFPSTITTARLAEVRGESAVRTVRPPDVPLL